MFLFPLYVTACNEKIFPLLYIDLLFAFYCVNAIYGLFQINDGSST